MDYIFQKKVSLNVFYISIIVPLLYLIGTGKLEKDYLIYLAIGILLINLFLIFYKTDTVQILGMLGIEGMNGEIGCNQHNIKCIDIIESSPGYSEPVKIININDTVVWKNISETTHTITATDKDGGYNPSGLFNSGYLRPGEAFAIKFIEPGQYPYYCVLHKGWQYGKIIVLPPIKTE
jgi:hypothetical protein